MVLITESFSGPPDLKPDHQILRDGGPVVHCLKMLISSPDGGKGGGCSVQAITVLCSKVHAGRLLVWMPKAITITWGGVGEGPISRTWQKKTLCTRY